jgi:glycosyltransferase involved in cell wall biosynthesis
VLDRRLAGVDRDRIHGCLPFFLATRVGALRARAGESRVSFWVRQNGAFASAVAQLDWGPADTVYAFNGSALEIFRRARERGLRCILDQTAAPWRYNTRLLRVEQARWPGWESRPADMDPEGCMTAREEAEWGLADRIICGSPFVVDAIREVGGPVEKCHVVPYPMPELQLPLKPTGPPQGRRVRVLFLGTLQLRKGIQYVWETAGHLGGEAFEFRAVGSSSLTPDAERLVRSRIDWLGRVGPGDVWRHYQWADVFLLPTLSEGSANVCREAAATGTCVMTTAAAGPVGLNATIVPADAASIAARLRTLARDACRHAEAPLPLPSLAEYGAALVLSMS